MKPAPFARFAAVLLALAVTASLPAEEQRARAPGRDSLANKIDLNTASEARLAAVPEIGTDGAKAIIAARPFASLNELDRVRGLSAEKLELIRSRVTVSAPPTRAPLGEPTMEKRPLGEPRSATAASEREARLPDLNTASEAELAAIPVIGPDVARQIVAQRPFTRIEELNKINGLTTEQLEQIRTLVRVEAPKPAKPAGKPAP